MFSVLAFLLALNVYAADNTFVFCSEASPSTFNPQLATDGSTFNASSRPIYNRLADFEDGGTKVLPSLAESWTVSKDGLTWTFKLRHGVKFHTTDYFKPTRDFNADDVTYAFGRMFYKTHPFFKVSGGTYEYFESMDMGKIIKDIKKVDDYTVQFILNKPEAPFLANMAMDFASITSKEYAEQLLAKKTPEKLDTEPIGTGPFIFKRYVKDSMIRYDANPNYFAGAPKIKTLVYSITPDASVRFQKLKAGECHLIAEPSPADLANIEKTPELKLIQQAGLNVGYVAMNVTQVPFDKLEVRKAVYYALNRKSYIDAIYRNHAALSIAPIPPSMWSYNSKLTDYDFNIEKAKQLLKQAGLEKGFETELWTLPVSRPYNPNGKKMGEMIQADLAKIGVKVKLVTFDWPTYLAKARKGEHKMLMMGWTGDNGDPDNFLNVLLGCAAVQAGSNFSMWCDQEYEKLIQAAKVSTDIKKRTGLYEKAQVRFKDQVPWVNLAHATVFRAMRSNVTGYEISPFGHEIFTKVELK